MVSEWARRGEGMGWGRFVVSLTWWGGGLEEGHLGGCEIKALPAIEPPAMNLSLCLRKAWDMLEGNDILGKRMVCVDAGARCQ